MARNGLDTRLRAFFMFKPKQKPSNMYIIIVDRLAKTIYSNYVTFPTKTKKSQFLRDKLNHELSLRDAGLLNFYQRDLTGIQNTEIPQTTAIVERAWDLFYIDIIGDITTPITH